MNKIICIICNIEKYTDEYSTSSLKRKQCKLCIKEKSKMYYNNNKTKIKQNKKEYYINNKDSLREKNKNYYYNNKDNLLIKNKEYRNKNKESIKNQRLEYRKNNKQKINKQQYKYEKIKLKTSINYKLKKNISTIIRRCLRFKKNSIIKILNYTIDDLKNHLESLFEPWMNWDNYGSYNYKNWKDNDLSTWKWNIDHIMPQSSFSFSSTEDEEFKKCWSLNNLRPYSAKQNVLDGNRRG